jgi:hypothetical protein
MFIDNNSITNQLIEIEAELNNENKIKFKFYTDIRTKMIKKAAKDLIKSLALDSSEDECENPWLISEVIGRVSDCMGVYCLNLCMPFYKEINDDKVCACQKGCSFSDLCPCKTETFNHMDDFANNTNNIMKGDDKND